MSEPKWENIRNRKSEQILQKFQQRLEALYKKH